MAYSRHASSAGLTSGVPIGTPRLRQAMGLRRILARSPVMAAAVFSVGWLALGQLIYVGLDWLMPDATYVSRSLVRASLSAAVVGGLLTSLGWWQRAGLVSRPGAQHLGYLVIPLVLEASPLVVHGLAWQSGVSLDLAISGLWAIWALLIAFAEEGMWRGVLLMALAPSGIRRAVLISAFAFGLTHLGSAFFGWPLTTVLPMVALTTGMGIMSGALALRLATLWPVILLHAGYDFLCLCPAFQVTRGMCGCVAFAFLAIGLAAAGYGLALLGLPAMAASPSLRRYSPQ